MRGILEAFPAVLSDLDPDGRAAEPIVFAAWKSCVDGALAEHVVPLRLEKQRLIAAVSNETWRRNVLDLGPALAAKINRLLGSGTIKFVEFQIDADAVNSHRRRCKEAEAAGLDHENAIAALPEQLRTASESIADDELRRRFLAAAGGSLARLERRQRTEAD